LQKWAEKKVKTLKKWSKEYDELCKAEGIKGNYMVSFALDRDYVASIHTMIENKEGMNEYLLDTKASFFRNGKWS
jgi:hypothetical protein